MSQKSSGNIIYNDRMHWLKNHILFVP